MEKQDCIDLINESSGEIESILSPERLEELNQVTDSYMEILKGEIRVGRELISNSKSKIEECTKLIEDNEIVIDTHAKQVSSASQDLRFCEELLPRIEKQKEMALLNIKVNELISNAQTFEEALKSRLERYKQELQESSFLSGVDNDFDMERVFETALSFMSRQVYGSYNPDWSSVKTRYNESIRELCELEAQGKTITLSKSKSRFDVIDRLIAKYEDKLFVK